MAWGLVFLGTALLIVFYFAAEQIKPRRSRAVTLVQDLRGNWKKYYGWTYLERPIAIVSTSVTARIGGWLARKLKIEDLFTAGLQRAGLTIDTEIFVFWHVTATIFLGWLGYAIGGVLLAIITAAAGAGAPFLVWPVLVKRRRTIIEEQLADTLQLISCLLWAGHGFPQALAAVTKETQPPISLAFRKALSRVNLGMSLEDSLDKMATEVGSITLNWAVTAIKIQREVGGNLSEILDILSMSIRERGELVRQVKALTAEGKLSAYILLGLPFVLAALLYRTNPSYVALLWETTPGIIMVAGAGILMTIGSIWLWRIVKIEV